VSKRVGFGGIVAVLGVAFAMAGPQTLARAETPSVPLVKADATPIKVKPKDPGGLKIPHQDKSIYERFETGRKIVPAGDTGKGQKNPRQHASAKPGDKKIAQDIGPYRIQLGSFTTTEKAQRRWNELKSKHADVFGHLQMVLERVEMKNKGTFVRLQAGPLKTSEDVQKLCATLGKRKVSCMLVKS
jgi:hypothetical protein